MATQDDVCDETVGESLLRLSLADAVARRVPQTAVELRIDYSKADALGGVVLPLEFIATGPTTVHRQVFTLLVPDSVVFTPQEPGTFVALLREMAHDRWTGTLRVAVDGKSRTT